MKEASFYTKDKESIVHCFLCAHGCRIAPGERGICGVRRNRGGTLVSLVYGRTVAENVDPIEKKPLFHFLPGSTQLLDRDGGVQLPLPALPERRHLADAPRRRADRRAPDARRRRSVRRALAAGCASIAYTYTEPTIFFEYALDTAVLASAAGLRNVFVTNGYITAEPLRAIAPYLDAANIDLKAFSRRDLQEDLRRAAAAGARRAEALRELGIWLEVTTLVIPGQNDSDEELGGSRGSSPKSSAASPLARLGVPPDLPAHERPAHAAARRCGGRGGSGWRPGCSSSTRATSPARARTRSAPRAAARIIARRGYTVRENRLRGRHVRTAAAAPGSGRSRGAFPHAKRRGDPASDLLRVLPVLGLEGCRLEPQRRARVAGGQRLHVLELATDRPRPDLGLLDRRGRLVELLVHFVEHLAVLAPLGLHGGQKLPDLARAFLDRERPEAHLEALQQRPEGRRAGDHDATVALERVGQPGRRTTSAKRPSVGRKRMPKSVVAGGLRYFSLISRAQARTRASSCRAAASAASGSARSWASTRRW